jgi:hypothetical protein
LAIVKAVAQIGALFVLAALLPVPVSAATSSGTYGFNPVVLAPGYTATAFIAVAGTLEAGQIVDLTLTGPAGPVLLRMGSTAAGGASATALGHPLGNAPLLVDLPTSGLQIEYRLPAVLPVTGQDSIRAQDPLNQALEGHVHYSYGRTVRFGFNPSPIAAAGSLVTQSSRLVYVTAYDSAGNPIPGATVYLTFTHSRTCYNPLSSCVSGGGAFVYSTQLSSIPIGPLLSQMSASTLIAFHLPGTLPWSGFDTIKAADRAVDPAVIATDVYTYG